MNLIEAAHLKALCARLGIDYVTAHGDGLVMRFSMAADIDLIQVLTTVKKYPRWLRSQGGNPPTIVYFERHKDVEALLRGAVKAMEQVVAAFEAAGEGEGSTHEDQQ